MSYRVVEWIMQQYVPDHACKLLLMVLGTHADDGGCCYPRVSTMGQEASMSPRTVHRVLARLAANHSELITWKRKSGSANTYQIHCPKFEGKNSTAKSEAPANNMAESSRRPPPNKLAHPGLPHGGRTENRHFNHQNPKHIDLSPVPRARGLSKRTRGEIEISLASRVGSSAGEGIEMLASLPSSELDQLLAQERVGTLTDLDIERVRSKWRADGWKRRREDWVEAFDQFKASVRRLDGETK